MASAVKAARQPVSRNAILDQSLVHIAGTDVKTNRQIKFAGNLPERIPMWVAEYRLPEVLRVAGEQNSSMAHRGASADLLGSRCNIPEGDRGDRKEAARIGRRPFGLPIVVNPHAGEHQLGIIELQKLLSAEAADIGIHHHRPDAHLVHVFEARLGLVGPGMHFLVAPRRIFEAAATGSGGHTRIREEAFLVSEHPSLSAFGVRLDAWNTVAHTGRRATGPHLWCLGYMGVGIDDGVTAHGLILQLLRGLSG